VRLTTSDKVKKFYFLRRQRDFLLMGTGLDLGSPNESLDCWPEKYP